MGKIKFFVLFTFLIGMGFQSCSSEDNSEGNSSDSRSSSSQQTYCVYSEAKLCTRGSSPCPGDGGKEADECPADYEGGKQPGGSGNSSSSGSEDGSSSDDGFSAELYEYCIFEAQRHCSEGDEPFSRCPPGGTLSHACPYTIEYGEFTDARDNQTYKTVVIGSQTWMAQNLNYFPPGTSVSPYGVSGAGVSACYADSSSYKISGQDFHIQADSSSKNCEKFGRLYDWATAMAFEQACNRKQCKPTDAQKHQGVCPDGWHVPTNDEWDELKNFAGGEFNGGPNLKATWSWDDYSKVVDWETYERETLSGNGFDAYGFAALAGGYFNAGDGIENMNIFAAKGQYHGMGKQGYWWTATEYTNYNLDPPKSVQAVSRLIKNEAYHIQSERQDKGDNWFYVRCVKD